MHQLLRSFCGTKSHWNWLLVLTRVQAYTVEVTDLVTGMSWTTKRRWSQFLKLIDEVCVLLLLEFVFLSFSCGHAYVSQCVSLLFLVGHTLI